MPDYRPPHLDSTAERPQAPVPEAAEAPPAPVEAGPPEPQCRFSQASLWQYQLQYYREAGVDVWRSGTVPSLISNNAAMARIWADTICAWLHDHEETLDLNEPLYVIELGAGAGRLAFLILKALSARRPTDPLLRKVKLKYVLTDIAEGTVDFWRNHPPLRPFHDNGSLDVAEWSPTSGEPLKLSKRRAPLSALRNPPIVIANYLIDSLPADVFAVENATLFEHMVTLTPLVDSFPKMEFDNVPAGAEPYGDPSLDSMLQFYRRKLTKGLFVFPIDALKAFENMERLFGPEMMILVADMGSSRVGAFEDITQWHPSFFDGAMAVDCNFHALGHWVKERGGTVPGHLPELSSVDAERFGVAVCTVDGQQFSFGDANIKVPLMQTIKPLLCVRLRTSACGCGCVNVAVWMAVCRCVCHCVCLAVSVSMSVCVCCVVEVVVCGRAP